MYITAQRVVTTEGEEGINTYLYLHGLGEWTSPLPEENPGVLERRLITIEPGQNQVAAFLDLVFLDGSPLPGLSAERPLRQWVECPMSMQRFAWVARLDSRVSREMVLLYSQCKAVFESYQASREPATSPSVVTLRPLSKM